MTSLAYVAIVDKLYDIMKSENAKSIPFKFISLYLLKELVKKGLNNENFLKYLSEKVCNKLAKWCAEGRLTNDGATLFSSTPSQNGRISRKSDEVWSKMFLKLALCCFDAWGNELSPGYPGLSRFKEKFEVLRSARVDFPESRQLYIEGLRYIIGSLKHLDISHCDFTADFSEMPSRVEASSLNISVPRFDNILPGTESTKLDQVYQGQSTTIEDNKKIVNQKPFLVDDSYTRKTPNQRYQVYTEIQEVVSSQEYSDIANQEDDHSDIETNKTINTDGKYDFSKQRTPNITLKPKSNQDEADSSAQKLRDQLHQALAALATEKAERSKYESRTNKLKQSNSDLLRDVEELTEENNKLLCKVRMLIDEESRLREQVHSQTQNKAELKAQLRHSFEGKSGFRNTPEKDFEMEHSLKNIDSSSINVCPTCESYREEVKELKSKLSFSKKDSEKINLQNGELLKQIRLMAKSESAVKQTKEKSPERFRDISSVTEVKYHEPKNNHSYQMNTDISLSRLGSAIKPTKDELSFRTHGPTSNIKDQPQQETPFKPMNADLAETLRSLKESQNRLESFQMKFSKEKEDMSSMNLRKTPVPRQAAFGESNQSNAIKDEADGVSSREQYSSFMAKYGIDSEQSILPGKKDFGTQRKGDTSNKLKSYMAENWNEKVDFGLNNGSVESFYQRFSRTEEGFGLNREKSLGDLGKNNQRCTAPAPSKEISVFKDLDKIDSFFKQDDIKIRSRRDERLLVTLDERIKADRSVDLTSKAYSRYGDQYNEQPNCIANRKQRKSIGHAPQSRYLERLSRLYEGNDDYGGASFTNDQSFASMKRASSSMDRKALTNTDSFLKQINDRISNLVTK